MTAAQRIAVRPVTLMKISSIHYHRNFYGRNGKHGHENVIIIARGRMRRLYYVKNSRIKSLRKMFNTWPDNGRPAAFDSQKYRFTFTLFDAE